VAREWMKRISKYGLEAEVSEITLREIENGDNLLDAINTGMYDWDI
jgi:hypothetical protein